MSVLLQLENTRMDLVVRPKSVHLIQGNIGQNTIIYEERINKVHVQLCFSRPK